MSLETLTEDGQRLGRMMSRRPALGRSTSVGLTTEKARSVSDGCQLDRRHCLNQWANL